MEKKLVNPLAHVRRRYFVELWLALLVYAGTIAKTIVEIADGNVHEAVSHLARTHFLKSHS